MKDYYVLNKIKNERAAKHLKQQNDTPMLSPAGKVNGKMLVIDTLHPSRRLLAQVLKTTKKNGRLMIILLECPDCKKPMEWDKEWKAFKCTDHKGIYELVG